MTALLEQEFANETEYARRLVAERPERWEFLLTQELLNSRIPPAKQRLYDLQHGMINRQPIPIIGTRYLADNFQVTLNTMRAEVHEIVQAITQDFLTSWRSASQPDDPVRIKNAADRALNACNKIIDLAIESYLSAPSSLFANLKKLLTEFSTKVAAYWLLQLEQFAQELGQPDKVNFSFNVSDQLQYDQYAEAVETEMQAVADAFAPITNADPEINVRAITLIKEGVVAALLDLILYPDMLVLTLPQIPTLVLSEDERRLFYRWMRENPEQAMVDAAWNEQYHADVNRVAHLLFALPYEIDGITSERVGQLTKQTTESLTFLGSSGTIDSLQLRLKRNPQDAQAYYELALHLMRRFGLDFRDLSGFDTEGNSQVTFRLAFYGGQNEIVDALSKALALGISNPLHEAVAKFSYAFMISSVIPYETRQLPPPQNLAKARIVYRDLIPDLEGYLRRYPHSLLALRILSACFKMQNQLERHQEVEIRIERALHLAELQIGDETSPLVNSRETVTAQQKGLEFEAVCLRLIRAMGFEAQTTAVTGDGGVDIVAVSTLPVIAGRYIIQCKAWKQSIGEPLVRDLYGVVHSERANKGILITTATFTKAALAFAQDKPLELIDGQQFYRLLQKYLPQVLGK